MKFTPESSSNGVIFVIFQRNHHKTEINHGQPRWNLFLPRFKNLNSLLLGVSLIWNKMKNNSWLGQNVDSENWQSTNQRRLSPNEPLSQTVRRSVHDSELTCLLTRALISETDTDKISFRNEMISIWSSQNLKLDSLGSSPDVFLICTGIGSPHRL